MANAISATFLLQLRCHFGMYAVMDAFANELIDAMGGTQEVATLALAPVRTIYNWRNRGLSPSRLDHLRRIAQDDLPTVDVEAIARRHGVELPQCLVINGSSAGKTTHVSGESGDDA